MKPENLQKANEIHGRLHDVEQLLDTAKSNQENNPKFEVYVKVYYAENSS